MDFTASTGLNPDFKSLHRGSMDFGLFTQSLRTRTEFVAAVGLTAAVLLSGEIDFVGAGCGWRVEGEDAVAAFG